MKKKNGFTLIELLAVIIILAVIALIATPIILNVVENARKKAFQSSANGYYDAARYLYDELYLNNDRQDLIFTFDDGVQNSSNEKYQLKVNGEKPKGGMVYLTEDGEILVSIQNGRYCATTDGTGKVNLSEDIENCGYTPEECFTYSDFTLTDTIKGYLTEENLEFEGMDESLLQIDSFDSENPSCRGIVFIPEEHEGRKIEGIKSSAFRDNTFITAIVLPKELKVINSHAFTHVSNLKQVVMNNELRYIGTYAFYGANIENVLIPEKVVYLGGGAFIGNGTKKVTVLGPITYPNNYNNVTTPTNVLTKNNPFMSRKVNNRKNEIEEVIIGKNVKIIPKNMFVNQQVKNLVLLEGITSIGVNAFAHNQLTSVTIPDSVTSIDAYAFGNNQLTSVIIPDSVTVIGGRAFNNNQLPDDQAFIYQRNDDGTEDKTTIIGYGGAKRDNVIIPNSVTSIGTGAFNNNQLTSVTIPNSVTTIESLAFSNNQFPNADAITIEGDATRFDSIWTSIGFPAK